MSVSRTAEFERLIDRYSGLISDAIRRVCVQHYGFAAPDVRQEVHLALWRQLEAGNKPQHEASYIYKVALTTALREVRRIRRERDVAAESALLSDQQQDTEDSSRDVARAALLESALGALEGHQRRAVKAYLAGFNHTEVAKLLNLSTAQARHAIYRGIERLNREIAAREDSVNEQPR